jgi:flavin-dependent dehydrogenase
MGAQVTMPHDAVVIGAGPAGSVTARELARRGRRVLLVDKATFPRPKVCGCCLSGAAVRTLERLGLGQALAGAVPLTRVRIAAGPRSADVRLPRGVALSREAFDVRLIDAAVREGVEFRANTTVSPRGRDATDAGVVVVASGLTGGDATPEPGSRIGAGVVLDAVRVPVFYTEGTIFMATGRGGYVGLVRVEDGRLDVAAAFDPAFVKASGGLGPAAADVLGSAGWPVPSELAGAPWKGTPALTRRPVRVAGERFFVVGDAAGYVEPFTGEGMAWAVMSAAALAPIAARDWRPGLAREWETAHSRVVANRQRMCRVVSRVLRSPRLCRLAVRALGLVPGLATPFTSALNHPAQLPT